MLFENSLESGEVSILHLAQRCSHIDVASAHEVHSGLYRDGVYLAEELVDQIQVLARR